MSDDNSTTEEPQAEPIPASEPDPEPLWDVTKVETRSANPPEGPGIIER
jgi:hypothetical protein